jgi:hypothetical protein
MGLTCGIDVPCLLFGGSSNSSSLPASLAEPAWPKNVSRLSLVLGRAAAFSIAVLS